MKRALSTLVAALILAVPAWAETGHAGHGTTMDQAAPSTTLSEGVVKKVDKKRGKLTLRHGPLANLGMPAMTMIFHVTDPAMLDRVKPGDNIRFRAEQVNGKLTATQIAVVQ
jgi:Cu(I)/Ag(I) efflux system protein CusF